MIFDILGISTVDRVLFSRPSAPVFDGIAGGRPMPS